MSPAEADLNCIVSNLQHLEQAGFDPKAWCPSASASIGGAAIRIARESLAGSGIMQVHPLGFARIPLTAWSLDQARVAVHIWSDGPMSQVPDDIHDHCYDFVAVCLTGGLRHTIFRSALDDETTEPASAFEYAAGSCAIAGATPGRTGAIIACGGFVVRAPQVYGLRHESLHVAEPLAAPTVTVQFQSRCLKPHARVFRRQGGHARQMDQAARTPSRRRFDEVLASLAQ